LLAEQEAANKSEDIIAGMEEAGIGEAEMEEAVMEEAALNEEIIEDTIELKTPFDKQEEENAIQMTRRSKKE